MKVTIAISSHYKYIDKTRPVLEKSLLKAGVSLDDVIYFIATPLGTKEVYKKVSNNEILVNHNSFDMNAITTSNIILNTETDEYFNTRESWFFTHDTVVFGKQFLKLLMTNLSMIQSEVIAFSKNFHNMNMGWMTTNHLKSLNTNEYMNKIGVFDDESVTNSFKTACVNWEGERVFYNQAPTGFCHHYLDKGHKPYYGDQQRLVEYYPDLDFYKIKLNYCSGHWKYGT